METAEMEVSCRRYRPCLPYPLAWHSRDDQATTAGVCREKVGVRSEDVYEWMSAH